MELFLQNTLSPKFAMGKSLDLIMFDEVWQYGSDETKDPDKLQDGVALFGASLAIA